MKTVNFNPNNYEQFMRRIKAFAIKKPQEFVISGSPDIVEWDNYRLYILLDNISANRQHKYCIETHVEKSALFARIKEYGKGVHELIKIINKENINQ